LYKLVNDLLTLDGHSALLHSEYHVLLPYILQSLHLCTLCSLCRHDITSAPFLVLCTSLVIIVPLVCILELITETVITGSYLHPWSVILWCYHNIALPSPQPPSC